MAAKKKAKRAAKRRTLKASPAVRKAAAKSAKRAARGAPFRKLGQGMGGKPKAGPGRPVLHGLFLSVPSCKVGLGLAMMGVAFDYRHVDLRAGAHKTPDFAAKNRFQQVPVLEHDGHFICQSNAILQHLADSYGKLGGRSKAEKLRVTEWLSWEQDRMVSVGLTRFFTRFEQRAADDPVLAWARTRAEAALGMLDRQLGQTKFLAGAEPTIADIAAFAWAAVANEGGLDVARWPNVQAWAERLMKLPGASHPYDAMPKEDRVAA